MDEAAFREQMKQGGYGEVSVSEYEAGYARDTHAHDFGASVLVVDGEISVTLEDRVVTCRAGDTFSLADIAAGAHLSAVDYLGDVPWENFEAGKIWYARVKSRPSFRAILADHIPGEPPPRHYADLDF